MNTFTKILLFALISAFSGSVNAQVILAKWTFPNNLLGDTIQNGTLPLNLNEAIRTEGTAAVTMTNGQTTGDYAVTAAGWDNGANVKNWNIHIATTGYYNITLSSKQRSGNTNAGPVNWKAQYQIGQSGTWTDVPGGTITVANDWTGALNNVALPSECSDVPVLFIRWIMTSNIGIGGGSVGSAGISKIDDIVISGTIITGVEKIVNNNNLILYPNPVKMMLNIKSDAIIKKILIYNYSGQCIYNTEINTEQTIVDVSRFDAGSYILKCLDNRNKIRTQKFEVSKH